MHTVDQKIEALRALGYDPVYAYTAEPGEVDEDHQHTFDTKLAIVTGEITIRTNGSEITLHEGDEIDVPRTQIHYAKVGDNGCTYIVAEKH